jgi:hypothetical protein
MHIIFRANQTLQSLTKNIENNTNIYNTKCMYINIFHDNSNNINLTLYIFIFLSVYIIKIYKIWLWPNLICKIFWAGGSTFVDVVHPFLVIKWLVRKIIDSSNSTAFFVPWSLPWNGPIFPRTHRSRSFFCCPPLIPNSGSLRSHVKKKEKVSVRSQESTKIKSLTTSLTYEWIFNWRVRYCCWTWGTWRTAGGKRGTHLLIFYPTSSSGPATHIGAGGLSVVTCRR